MTAIVSHLSGLHGASLEAFRECQAIVDAAMSVRAEAGMREVRKLLGYARDVFPIDRECADAFGARAANKLAAVIGAQR